MGKNNDFSIFSYLKFYSPIIILLIANLNEFDFNYLKLDYFSFNFSFILIFYWSLKSPQQLPIILIFICGLFNDVVTSLPIGLSSLNYLLICGATAYVRNITLRPNFMNDWMLFLITILILNSINFLILGVTASKTAFFAFSSATSLILRASAIACSYNSSDISTYSMFV